MKKHNAKLDIWGDAFRIFLAYISRKLHENLDYKPHPLIRALQCALAGTEKVKPNEHTMGISDPYVVVLQKNPDGRIAIKEIRVLATDRELTVEAMIAIFRLQILLDKIDGDVTSQDEAVDALNRVIPTAHFHLLGGRWREARDEFIKKAKEGKIHFPSSFKNSALSTELLKITNDTPWEEYSPQLRSLIGSAYAEIIDQRSGSVIIVSPAGVKIEKSKIFEMTVDFFLGKGAEYLGDRDCIFCNEREYRKYVIALRDNFTILADKNPLVADHILVISRDHVRAMGDLNEEKLLELSEIVNTIEKFYASDGNKYVMFEPGFAGQSVCHAHIHFLPGDFLITEAISCIEPPITELRTIIEIEDFYKKNGRYFLWKQKSKILVCGLKGRTVQSSYFRSLIAGQLMTSAVINWKDYGLHHGLREKAKFQISELLKKWQKMEWNNALE